MNTKFIAILLVVAVVSFGVGSYIGATTIHNQYMNIAFRFLENQNIDLEFDQEVFSTAVFQYRNHIGSCLFAED